MDRDQRDLVYCERRLVGHARYQRNCLDRSTRRHDQLHADLRGSRWLLIRNEGGHGQRRTHGNVERESKHRPERQQRNSYLGIGQCDFVRGFRRLVWKRCDGGEPVDRGTLEFCDLHFDLHRYRRVRQHLDDCSRRTATGGKPERQSRQYCQRRRVNVDVEFFECDSVHGVRRMVRHGCDKRHSILGPSFDNDNVHPDV